MPEVLVVGDMWAKTFVPAQAKACGWLIIRVTDVAGVPQCRSGIHPGGLTAMVVAGCGAIAGGIGTRITLGAHIRSTTVVGPARREAAGCGCRTPVGGQLG